MLCDESVQVGNYNEVLSFWWTWIFACFILSRWVLQLALVVLVYITLHILIPVHVSTVISSLPRKTDMERKIEIYNFSARTRQLFVRLLALVKWASSASKVDKSAVSTIVIYVACVFVDGWYDLVWMCNEHLVIPYTYIVGLWAYLSFWKIMALSWHMFQVLNSWIYFVLLYWLL